jgi:hypothetical protein
MWPTVAVLAFLALIGVVVALGASSTARYEFERNGAQEQRQAARSTVAHPAGRRSATRSTRTPEGSDGQPQAVGVAVRPIEAPAVEVADGSGWWLVVDGGAHAVAGPFRDRVDAEWAALGGGLEASAMYGVLREDGGLVRRPSPEERAWLTELAAQLERLPEDWDALLSDTDPLTTLVVEVAAALVDAGLSLHDSAQQSPSGGVSLVPVPEHGGVLVSWRPHDRMSVLQVRGAEADGLVQLAMNDALAEVLEQIGFVVERFTETGSHLVTAIRP